MTPQTTTALDVDPDPRETAEWLGALGSVFTREGAERAAFLLERQREFGSTRGLNAGGCNNSAYLNTVPADRAQRLPGDPLLERRLEATFRWNALATVLRANRDNSGL